MRRCAIKLGTWPARMVRHSNAQNDSIVLQTLARAVKTQRWRLGLGVATTSVAGVAVFAVLTSAAAGGVQHQDRSA